MIANLLIFILCIGLFYMTTQLTKKRLMRYLHGLQQDDYDNQRFLSWLIQNKTFDQTLSLGLVLMACLSAYVLPYGISLVVLIFGLWVASFYEPDPRKEAKKPLALTSRAQRILNLATSIACLFIAFIMIYLWQTSHLVVVCFSMVILLQALPLVLVCANTLLRPFEASIQQAFYEDAQNQLKHCQPKVIGITGSFGKTSVKHILHHLLNTYTPTLMTPGSVNTVMGITRIIREQLETRHEFFIVEMGAYGQGSIARLCELTPPDFGIISSIGHAHYERFKSLENVAQTKFELAESVLKKNNASTSNVPHLFINQQTLGFDNGLKVYKTAPHEFIVCTRAPKEQTPTEKQPTQAQLEIHNIQQTAQGLHVDLTYQEASYTIDAPLFGHHHGENLALAFVCALNLGVPNTLLSKAMNSMPQIPHRLEKKEQTGGWVILDDAYNSNPIGFHSALDVLSEITISGRKILVTPGIVELGEQHDEVHENLGQKAARICDIVCVVQPKRIPSFVKAAASVENIELKLFDTFQAAQQWLLAFVQKGDWVLLENDLPDLYERKLQL